MQRTGVQGLNKKSHWLILSLALLIKTVLNNPPFTHQNFAFVRNFEINPSWHSFCKMKAISIIALQFVFCTTACQYHYIWFAFGFRRQWSPHCYVHVWLDGVAKSLWSSILGRLEFQRSQKWFCPCLAFLSPCYNYISISRCSAS